MYLLTILSRRKRLQRFPLSLVLKSNVRFLSTKQFWRNVSRAGPLWYASYSTSAGTQPINIVQQWTFNRFPLVTRLSSVCSFSQRKGEETFPGIPFFSCQGPVVRSVQICISKTSAVSGGFKQIYWDVFVFQMLPLYAEDIPRVSGKEEVTHISVLFTCYRQNNTQTQSFNACLLQMIWGCNSGKPSPLCPPPFASFTYSESVSNIPTLRPLILSTGEVSSTVWDRPGIWEVGPVTPEFTIPGFMPAIKTVRSRGEGNT